MRARYVFLLLVGLAVGFVAGHGTAAKLRLPEMDGTTGRTPAMVMEPAATVPTLKDLSPEEKRDIDVFRRAAPSVVNITSIALRRNVFSFDIQQIPRGTGSGFIWDQRGHIVTNFHVIQEGDAFSVTLADQSEWEAKVAGVAPAKDLALLKITAPAERLVPLMPGTSRGLMVGQRVFAVGNPFGLDHSLTVGVLSALGRELQSPSGRRIRDVIQTDAAINPGNSGGPLLDSSGRLIGVNAAIYSPSGASAGIGFAVPVDTVSRLVPQLIERGRAVEAGIGATFIPASFTGGLEGVALAEVLPNGPAARAGLVGVQVTRARRLVLGDRILAVDGKSVRSEDDVRDIFEGAGIGTTVTLTVTRGDRKRDVRVQLVQVDERA